MDPGRHAVVRSLGGEASPLGAALAAAGFQVSMIGAGGAGAPGPDDVARAFAGLRGAGAPRVIVNALGLPAGGGAADELDALLLLLLGAQEAIRCLGDQGRGRLVNVASGADPGAARAGALALGRALREELRDRGLGVTTLLAGPGADPAALARLAALSAEHLGPGGLEEAVLT